MVPAGEWHMYRRDQQLTGRCTLPGNIVHPVIRWKYFLGGSENECFSVPNSQGGADLLLAYGGCVVRMDWKGNHLWKTPSFGINAIGVVEDIDGDGKWEVVASTGYEVFVLSAEDGEVFLREYVGFPASAGTPANMMLCHRFDPKAKGMHLIIPMMSSKEVRVFDFRGGARNPVLAHTLWMDDAYHPTVAAADMDNDGIDELVVSKLSSLYVFDVFNGKMKSSVQWTSNGERHRNYGLLQLIDINNDGVREAVIVSDRVARHLSVVTNDGAGNLALLWDRFVEFIYPSDTTEVRNVGNSVSDVDGDGKPELIVGFFNDRKDNRWWLEIINPLTGAVKHEIADRYLWGVQDVDGDGVFELLVSEEFGRQTKTFSRVEILKLMDGKLKQVWHHPHAHFAGRSLRPHGWKSRFRDVAFFPDETWSDRRGSAMCVFLFTEDDNGRRSLLELEIREERFHLSSMPLDTVHTTMMVALADVDGDGMNECILSVVDGRMMVVGKKTIMGMFMTGFRLQLEGFSAARPSSIPIIYRDGESEKKYIALPDNTNTIHCLCTNSSGDSAELVWNGRGRGHIGYDMAYHSLSVHNIDGRMNVHAVNPDTTDVSELVVFNTSGELQKSRVIPGAPAPMPVRMGVYEWSVLERDGKNDLVASYYSSSSMNSEQSICIDVNGKTRWHLTEYGEGEWGRGMGPYSSFSVRENKNGELELLFLAKDLLCHLDARTGKWIREPWLLWRATNTVMNQPDWEFTKDRLPLFGTDKDPFTAYGSPILVDVDNDGNEEIVVGGCFGGMGVLRMDHSIVWWKRTSFTDVMMRLPGIAEIEHGVRCVGICHSNGEFDCYDGKTGTERWKLNLGSTTSDIVSCDIDGDGNEEFITGTTDGRLISIGEDAQGRGEIKWSVPVGFALGSPVIADADGDGLPEVLVVTGDGYLVCIGNGV